MGEVLKTALDLAIASFLLYRILLLIRGTRSMQVAIGLAVLVALTSVVNMLDFSVTSWLLEKFWLAGVVLVVVIFQPEIRQALADLGKGPRIAKILFSENLDFLDEIFGALSKMSSAKIGALIALEQETGLKNYAGAGISLHADVTEELLLTVFHPASPLHDGAVIIGADGRLIAAKGIFPLTDDPGVSKSYGLRHRAAVGLSEVSDAIVLLVSEQTGAVQMARNGRLDPEIDLKEMLRQLRHLYQTKTRRNLLRPFVEAHGAAGGFKEEAPKGDGNPVIRDRRDSR